MIRTKCVYSDIARRADGLRVLVTRIRGRGLSSERYDVWMANLGPSERLLRAFQADRITWPEFAKRYKQELFEDGGVDNRNQLIKNHGQKFTLRLLQHLANAQRLTLLCHCPEDESHCHRHLLQRVLHSKI